MTCIHLHWRLAIKNVTGCWKSIMLYTICLAPSLGVLCLSESHNFSEQQKISHKRPFFFKITTCTRAVFSLEAINQLMSLSYFHYCSPKGTGFVVKITEMRRCGDASHKSKHPIYQNDSNQILTKWQTVRHFAEINFSMNNNILN